jgi:hypothetical protein
VLDDLVARGLRTPEFLITDGAAGLERALAALWPDVPAQRCIVHTIRTQSAVGPWWTVRAVAVGGHRRWAQRDDMADFETAIAHDDTLDDELQHCLLLRERRLVQACADATAERCKVSPYDPDTSSRFQRNRRAGAAAPTSGGGGSRVAGALTPAWAG